MNRSEDALKVTVLTMAVLFLAVIIIMIFCIRGAAAHDHEHPELNSWYERLTNENGTSCCDGSDAKRVDDADWDTKSGADGNVHYRVKIDGEWVDVPDQSVIRGPNRAGRTMVWPYYIDGHPRARCFAPGSMT